MFLIDKYHFFKRFKKPLENNFSIQESLASDREAYIEGFNLPFYNVKDVPILIVNDSSAYILIDGSNITIDGNFSTLIIEDVSNSDGTIKIINNQNSKIIFINNPQTGLCVEREILIDNHASLELFLTVNKKDTFIKNNLLVNLLEGSSFNGEVFVNAGMAQTFDLTAEIVHKFVKTNSNINFVGLNEGRVVSQINSIIEKEFVDCELRQHIKHILFNEDSISYSKPSLMISVPCVASHGNSIGSIPEDWLFYLQTKGIPPDACLEIIKKSLQKIFFDKMNISFIEGILGYEHES